MQTEGETDTGSDENSGGRHVRMIGATKTPNGNKNLYHGNDDSFEEKWGKEAEAEARDMKRQLKHYITQSNVHDLNLHISPSDLESGTENNDVTDAENSTVNLLFPVKKRKGHNARVEAESVRNKLDSVTTTVNELIEDLENEKKKIKDKKVLSFLANLQNQLSGVQDNVEDAESELKTEEKKYSAIYKDNEKTRKKYEQLIEKQEREEREKQEKLIKEQEKKLKEQESKIQQLEQMRQLGWQTSGGPTPQGPNNNNNSTTPHGRQASSLQAFAAQTPFVASPRGAQAIGFNNNALSTASPPMTYQQQQQRPVSTHGGLNAIPQEPTQFSLEDRVKLDTNGDDDEEEDDDNNNNTVAIHQSPRSNYQPHQAQTPPLNSMPIANALAQTPRGRDKHRRGRRHTESRSASRGRRNNNNNNATGQASASGDSNAPAAPHIISDSPDDDELFHASRQQQQLQQQQRRGSGRHSGGGGGGKGSNRGSNRGSHSHRTPHNHNNNNNNNGIMFDLDANLTGHRNSNEMHESPIPIQQQQQQNTLMRSTSHHSSHHSNRNANGNIMNNNNNNNGPNYLQNNNNNINNHPLSVSSGSRAPNSGPNPLDVPAAAAGGVGPPMGMGMGMRMYSSPQPGLSGAFSEGPGGYMAYDMSQMQGAQGQQIYNDPNMEFDHNNHYDQYGGNNSNNNMQYQVPLQQQHELQVQQNKTSQPIVSDTSVKVIAGTVVALAAVYIISKWLDKSGKDNFLPAVVRRPPRPRGY